MDEYNENQEGWEADWFRIGGRWSGQLTRARLNKDKLDKFQKKFKDIGGNYISKHQPEEARMIQAYKLFKKIFPDYKGLLPVARPYYGGDTYGCSDDAQIVDECLYDELLKDKEGLSEKRGDHFGALHYLDLEGDPVSKNFINNKWLVIVDYHH